MNFLSKSIQKIINKIGNKKYIQQNDIDNIMQEINPALLKADVDYEVVNKFNELIKQQTLNMQLLKGLTPQQQVIKIIQNTLTNILGNKSLPLNFQDNKLNIFLLIGMKGSGKTTIAGKLAFFINKQKIDKILLIAADYHRPGGIQQLQQIGKNINIEVYNDNNTNNSLEVILNGINYAKKNHFQVVIIDTTGFSPEDTASIDNLSLIKKNIKPDETLMVVDALGGQQISGKIKQINEKLSFTGVIMTKMDAKTSGGLILSIRYITKLAIRFISSSEQHNDDNFELFYPDRIASRILGMGDLSTLIENIEAKIDPKQNAELIDKLFQDNYNYYDLQKHLNLIKKMGSFQKILNFIPGISNKISNLNILDNNIIIKFEAIIKSMTHKERLNPELIANNNRRRHRIIKGSGTTNQEINLLIDFIEKQKTLTKQIDNKNLKKDSITDYQDLINKFLDSK
ncbi:signal recognition particle protein [Candidatus Phytoplasma citri]|uniref:signal-recognition-particle GTPase n=1 Tax=Candidatus Phytoplasma citri TaxID=180978 RepID=A0A1S9LZY5_9MOLU|nr:signal recognition particle receptor subunit alpha [Candidatus Phytoplasma aurantifolia]MDO8060074.1 signal recognition particle receptor subunit alpha [Candidatus Phytoplasma aurantifolia]MDO8078827.1 signal recognition particle receptor subunit alpha [Candidatus Phytoplasma aurantifolia]OOP58556.1 signal recognition particle protein [Candidatus Phytoplasma aurantifolia]